MKSDTSSLLICYTLWYVTGLLSITQGNKFLFVNKDQPSSRFTMIMLWNMSLTFTNSHVSVLYWKTLTWSLLYTTNTSVNWTYIVHVIMRHVRLNIKTRILQQTLFCGPYSEVFTLIKIICYIPGLALLSHLTDILVKRRWTWKQRHFWQIINVNCDFYCFFTIIDRKLTLRMFRVIDLFTSGNSEPRDIEGSEQGQIQEGWANIEWCLTDIAGHFVSHEKIQSYSGWAPRIMERQSNRNNVDDTR